MNGGNGVTLAYFDCAYDDLQHIGMEMINEGTLQLIARNADTIHEIMDEYEEEE